MSIASDVQRREAEWRTHLETCDCQVYRGEARELTPEAQVYYLEQAAAAPLLADEVERLTTALAAAEKDRDAYRRAKAENDERFQIERDQARMECERLRATLAAETERRIAAERACWIGMCELTPWDGMGERPCPEEAFKAMDGPSKNYHRERFGKGKK